MDCPCLLLRSVPDFSVHSWGFLARIFRHSSNGKNFAAIRAGQQTLQGFHLVPLAGLPCLHDTHLKSSNVTVDGLPINGKPFCRSAGDSTNGLHRRHLPCLLSRFLELSRVKDQGNVCPLSRPVMLSVWLTQPVSTSLQRGIRFFSFRTPAALWIRLAAFLPYAGNVTGITLLPSE